MALQWDVGFGELIRGRFVARLSRFHARVLTEDGREAVAHLPNSGRLHEVLLAGNEVWLAPRRGPRTTAFDLLLARVPGHELGPDAPPGTLACLDARLPPRVVAAAVARGAIPAFEGLTLARWEPALGWGGGIAAPGGEGACGRGRSVSAGGREGACGPGRADLLLAGPGGEVVVETKSSTLVRAGAGLFPDCPTRRGASHALALARRAGGGWRAAVVFVLQRPDAMAFRVHEPADPGFARALRRAQRAGVEVLCGVCDVSVEGIRWRGEVPFQWPPRQLPEDELPTLPDHLRPGLALVVCGMNPGRYAAWYGMYFARPGNLFWPAMRAAGLVPPTAGPGDEAWLCRTLGIGFTDVVKRPTASIEELKAHEWREGAARLRRLLRDLRPRGVCFVGLAGVRAVLGPHARPGPQPHPVEGVPAFALPATSGRQAAYRRREVFRWFGELARWAGGLGISPPNPARTRSMPANSDPASGRQWRGRSLQLGP